MPDSYNYKDSELCKKCIVQACCDFLCQDRISIMFETMPPMNYENKWTQEYNQRCLGVVRVDSNAT